MRYYVEQLLQLLPPKMQTASTAYFQRSNYSHRITVYRNFAATSLSINLDSQTEACSQRGGTSAVTINRDGSADRVFYVAAVPPSLPPVPSTRLKPALQLHLYSKAGETNVLIETANR